MFRTMALVLLGGLILARPSMAAEPRPSREELDPALIQPDASHGAIEVNPDDDARPEKAETKTPKDDASTEATPSDASEPAKETPALKDSDPVAIRLNSLRKPLHFKSQGQVKAMLMRVHTRDLRITLELPAGDENATKIKATVVDMANHGKRTVGLLDIQPDGSLKSSNADLTNACNICSIGPALRAKLLRNPGPFTTSGSMEAAGTVREVEFTHRRVGEVADDGSMKIETKTKSEDGKVNLNTDTTMAPDGIPWLAHTTGTLKKGPLSLRVDITMTREDAPTETGE